MALPDVNRALHQHLLVFGKSLLAVLSATLVAVQANATLSALPNVARLVTDREAVKTLLLSAVLGGYAGAQYPIKAGKTDAFVRLLVKENLKVQCSAVQCSGVSCDCGWVSLASPCSPYCVGCCLPLLCSTKLCPFPTVPRPCPRPSCHASCSPVASQPSCPSPTHPSPTPASCT